MQQDITISLDLPLRIAIVDVDGQTLLVHQTSDDFSNNYQVKDHPVLEKIELLFSKLASELLDSWVDNHLFLVKTQLLIFRS